MATAIMKQKGIPEMDDVEEIISKISEESPYKRRQTQKRTWMTVPEMGKLLGLKKTDRYWLVHKNVFESKEIAGKIRINIASFEKWYANQIKYHKVTGEEPGKELKSWSYSVKEVADLLGVDDYLVYDLLKKNQMEAVIVDYWKRIPKESFQNWYKSQSRYRTKEDREKDALLEDATITMPEMAQLLGTPGEYDAIQAELRGVIFKDPMAPDAVEVGWQTADDYLSGDVRSKLRVAQMAADRDSSFHINVEALQKAQPKDLDASEIDVRLGATWIDADYIQQFMEETFETPYYLRRSIEVKFSELTAEWRINGKSSPNYNDVAAYVTYGTERANAYRILEETLNLKDIRIYDTIEDADG